MLIKRLTALFAILAVGALFSGPATAGTTISAYQFDYDYDFIGSGGPGSIIQVRSWLYETSAKQNKIGSKEAWCQITGYNNQGHPLLWCVETLVFDGKGTLESQGEVNQTLIESYVPQTIDIIAGSGIYAGATGTQTIQQVVFPTEYQLTINLD